MADLFHGVGLRFSTIGAAGVDQIPSNIIALIGTAPSGPVNSLIKANNFKDDVAFGNQVPGFTIPYALDLIRKNAGGTPVVVINVFDPAVHFTAVVSEAVAITGGKGKTAFPYVGTSPVVKNTGGTVTYVKDQDYSIDAYGNIVSKNYTLIPATGSVAVTYSKPNFTAITSAEIIGTFNGTTGARTGLKLLENCSNLLAVEPRILIAPGFSQMIAITNELAVWDARLGSVAIIDAPSGTTLPAVKTGRTPAGTINFNVGFKDLILAYPEVKAYDPATDSQVNRPYSPALAGVMARTDREESFSKSPSNEYIYGISGLAIQMSGSAVNADTDVNDLNLLGITTILAEGQGFKVWGNRNAAFPSTTTPDNFIAVYRTGWIIGRSLQKTAIQYVDKRINQVLVDQIRQTGNNYINKLIGDGDLLDGSEVEYDALSSNWAAGKLEFLVRIAPPTPGELITFNIGLDLSIYANLNAA